MRSYREHCASRVAVEEEEERRGGGGVGEEQATDIKSNSPHLTGGEKHVVLSGLTRLRGALKTSIHLTVLQVCEGIATS